MFLNELFSANFFVDREIYPEIIAVKEIYLPINIDK